MPQMTDVQVSSTTAPSRPESYHVHDVAPYINLENGLTVDYLLGRACKHEHRHM